MSSDLERFRDHCRTMAAAVHVETCGTWSRSWLGVGKHRPDPACTGCVSATDRALWQQLADEIDEHLHDHVQPMLGEA